MINLSTMRDKKRKLKAFHSQRSLPMETANAVMAEARGFMKSRVILTATELSFFTRLYENPCDAEQLARENGLDALATTRVLDCLVAIGLLEKQNGVYMTTEKGAFFSSSHPKTVQPMVLYMNHLWGTWSDLTEIMKTRGHSEQKPGIQLDDANWSTFIGAMHVVGRELSQKIADDYDLSRFRRLLDIGGASGTYTIAFLQRNPAMTAVLFELEHVIPMAKKRLEENKIEHRVELVVGDFYSDELPTGCDLALLSAIIHQNNSEQNLNLYTKIYNALESGGTVLIRDHIMDESRTKPPAGALFAINMLVNRRCGDTYTFAEIKEGLEKAGFTGVRQVRYGEGMESLVEARKP
jgi:predicted transcriptional regulator/predicted O-methyltransferase YrrM